MKLWLLQPIEKPKDDNPWDPWYDKAFGFVVRAETELQARQMAHEQGGDETRDADAWLHSNYSTCVELTADGEPGVVLMDFAAA